MNTAVVVLSYGPISQALQLVDELVRTGFDTQKLVIVHNPSAEVSAAVADGIEILEMPRNLGYGAAMNRGIEWAIGRGMDSFLLLTHDSRLSAQCVEAMKTALGNDPHIGAVGVRVVNRSSGDVFSLGGRWRFGQATHFTTPRSSEDVDWIDGCAVLISRAAFEAVGPLEESFFLYCEDVEYGLRLKRGGWRLVVLEEQSVEQQSGRDGIRGATHDYCIQRNELEVARRYGSWALVLRVMLRHVRRPHVRASRIGRLGMLRADVDFLFRRFGPPPPGFLRGTDVSGLEGSRVKRPPRRIPFVVLAQRSASQPGHLLLWARLRWLGRIHSRPGGRLLRQVAGAGRQMTADVSPIWRSLRSPSLQPTTERPRLLVVDQQLSDGESDAGVVRHLELVSGLVRAGCDVVVASTSQPSHVAVRANEAVGAVVHPGMLDRRAFLDLAASADAIMLCRPAVGAWLLPLIRLRFPGKPVVYDMVDVHWVREERELRSTAVGSESQVSARRSMENLIMKGSDVTIAVSSADLAHMAGIEPRLGPLVIPCVHRVSEPSSSSVRGSRKGLLFVGSFRHAPNADAVSWLIDEIVPMLAGVDDLFPIRIVGEREEKAAPVPETLGVEWLGWVDDLTQLHDSSVALVAPLRFGAGVKGKVTFAMAHGLPVVGTSIAAEGLNASHEQHMLIADDAEGIAAALQRLSGDDALWHRISTEARNLASASFSIERLDDALADLLHMLALVPQQRGAKPC